jgi:hypothetical protein
MPKVIRVRLEQLQVIWVIVPIFIVDVVNDLARLQEPPEFLLHYETMLEHIPSPTLPRLSGVRMPRRIQHHITLMSHDPTSCPAVVSGSSLRSTRRRRNLHLSKNASDLLLQHWKIQFTLNFRRIETFHPETIDGLQVRLQGRAG